MESSGAAMEAQPHEEAIFLVLTYLLLYELLTVSQVCRSLRRAVNDDVLPWLNHLVVGEPLNRRLSNDALIQIASKARGRLSALALMGCDRIADDGLLSVVALNPFISKLHVPGCTRLTPDGLLGAVKALTQGHRLTSLQIRGIYGFKPEHLLILHSHLLPSKSENREPLFRHDFINSPESCFKENSNRLIDVEICPNCDQVSMVFDCPREACKMESPSRQCRGCSTCIVRCVECGKCLAGDDDQEQLDVACSDPLCSKCWLQLPKCNYCNKPCCSRHVGEQKSPTDGSIGFLCSFCHFQYVQLPSDYGTNSWDLSEEFDI